MTIQKPLLYAKSNAGAPNQPQLGSLSFQCGRLVELTQPGCLGLYKLLDCPFSTLGLLEYQRNQFLELLCQPGCHRVD